MGESVQSREYPLEVRQELAYVLRRIEYGIDVDANVGKVWRLCANYRMDAGFLIPFVKAAVLAPHKVLEALAGNAPETADDKKIAVISCVNNDRKYEECLLYLKRCSLPEGMRLEFIPIYHAKSMAGGYQEGMQSSNAKYKIYIHQDLCIVETDALQTMLHIFQKHPEVGMIGFAGCDKLPANGLWYETKGNPYGVAVQATAPERIVRLSFRKTAREFETVEAVDGIFMMTQYDIPWRYDLFCGWHFYDISQSMEFRKQGYRIAVPKADDIWCIHDSPSVIDVDYEETRRLFVKTYQDWL